MEKETLKKIFDFLEENDNKRKPLMWKLKNNIPIIEKDDLIVKGSLDLSSSNITSLPKGLEVKGSLILYESEIISLPEGLKVGIDLDLRSSYIESLPEGLEVGDELDLAYTYITSLPKGLKVGGLLIIIESDLLKYSDEEIRKMIEPGYIKKKIVREYYR
jgi:hypothetical protein